MFLEFFFSRYTVLVYGQKYVKIYKANLMVTLVDHPMSLRHVLCSQRNVPFSDLFIHIDQAPCRCLLYDELPTLIASLSPTTLKSLLDTFQSETGSSYLHGIYGLQKALKVPDPPPAVASVLLDCLKEVYKTQRSLCRIDVSV